MRELIKQKNGVSIYKEDDNYYFKGKNVDNYVYYYGNLYRIVSVTNDGIKLISNDSVTSMVYGVNKVFSTSSVSETVVSTISSTVSTLSSTFTVKSSKQAYFETTSATETAIS